MPSTGRVPSYLVALLAANAIATAALAEPDAAELAKELANPVSSLVSVPLQVNVDDNIGALDEGSRVAFVVQPVIPFSLNEDWNLISRTIVPLIRQHDIFPGSGSQSGTSAIPIQSLFFSPVKSFHQWLDLGCWSRAPAADIDRPVALVLVNGALVPRRSH